MQFVKPIKGPAPPRAHIIEGTWITRSLRIDGQRVSLAIVKKRLRGDGFYDEQGFADVQAFAWGAEAPPKTLRVLAYACGACTMPEPWLHHIHAHMALEEFFIAQLHQLPAADFTLGYTEKELRYAIQHIKLMWNDKVKVM